MSPFDPADDDLARIDRARVEAWLREHGWRTVAGDVWARSHGLPLRLARHGIGWREVLRAVARAHGLRGLALWSVLVQWQAPPEADE